MLYMGEKLGLLRLG